MFNKTTHILCMRCGLECGVEYYTVFEKWIRKVKYCPYCGHALSKELELPALVEYEKSNEKK